MAIPEVTDDDLAFFDREELRDMLFFPRKNTRVDTLPGGPPRCACEGVCLQQGGGLKNGWLRM